MQLPYHHLCDQTIYTNPLSTASDLTGFHHEGPVTSTFAYNRWRFATAPTTSADHDTHAVTWCPQPFPDHIHLAWSFQPLADPGLAMLFFAARGIDGTDLLNSSLANRNGIYSQYHHGDINALHLSYFRRKMATEREFTTCNLRKSHGFHLVAQGADPLPAITDISRPYRVWLVKSGPHVRFGIDQLQCLRWYDSGEHYGPLLSAGHIGFRQMSPLIAEYHDLTVHSLKQPL